MPLAGLLFLLAIVAALDALSFAGLRRAFCAHERRRFGRALAVVYWLGSALVLVAAGWTFFYGPRTVDNEPNVPDAVVVAVIAVYLPKIVLAALTAAELVCRVCAWMFRRLRAPREARESWLTRVRLLPRFGVAAAALVLAVVAWGATFGRNEVRVYRHEIRSARLPAEFDGLRVVHLSDIHAASLGASAADLTDRVVATVNAERPDLVLYTGDYGSASDLQRGPEILGRVQASLGKFAVLGNHDFGGRERARDNWTSAEDKRDKIAALARGFRSAGFILLTNDAALISKKSAAIAVLGVGVYDPHHGFDDADLQRAEGAAREAPFRLLMAHSPQYWERAVQGRRAIEVTLAGHTHGAQVGVGVGTLVWSPASLEFRHWGGLYREGGQYLNVNRGTGYVGLPFRVNMPADVSLLVLRSEKTAVAGVPTPGGTASTP